MRIYYRKASLLAAFLCAASALSASPIEEAREAWTSGDKSRAFQLYAPLAAEGIVDAELVAGGIFLALGIKDKDQTTIDGARKLLDSAISKGSGEAAGTLCSIFFHEENPGLKWPSDKELARYCDIAAADVGKKLPEIFLDRDYVMRSTVIAGRLHYFAGHHLQAASCFASYVRQYGAMKREGRAGQIERSTNEYASNGLAQIFSERVLRGGFQGGNSDIFGPLGIEPIPPCGVSATEVGVMAGSTMLERALGSR